MESKDYQVQVEKKRIRVKRDRVIDILSITEIAISRGYWMNRKKEDWEVKKSDINTANQWDYKNPGLLSPHLLPNRYAWRIWIFLKYCLKERMWSANGSNRAFSQYNNDNVVLGNWQIHTFTPTIRRLGQRSLTAFLMIWKLHSLIWADFRQEISNICENLRKHGPIENSASAPLHKFRGAAI